MKTPPLERVLKAQRVLICVGSGGVGKTTVAAALALKAAVEGRASIVCTIDPAKRLANALGLQALGNAEARIPEASFQAAGIVPKAAMHAMMLDMKQTWDELIHRYAPADLKERILSNRFYRSLSSTLAGSQEYIAMEKLWQLRQRSEYALVVLDTPPAAHAMDFLEAPHRVLDFLDNEAARWLLSPALAAGKVGLSLFNLGSSYVLKALSRFTGTETLQELAQFLRAFSSMNESFRTRARGVRALLEDRDTSFVLVTSPRPERLDEAIHFHDLLKRRQMDVAAIVVNRVHVEPEPALWAAAQTFASPLRERMLATLEELRTLAAMDSQGMKQLEAACSGTPLVTVPRFDLDVHELSGLWRTAQSLVQAPTAASQE